MDHFGNEKNESTSTLEMVRWQQQRKVKFFQPNSNRFILTTNLNPMLL